MDGRRAVVAKPTGRLQSVQVRPRALLDHTAWEIPSLTLSRPCARVLGASAQVFAKKGKGKGVIRQSAGVTGLAGNTGPAGQQVRPSRRKDLGLCRGCTLLVRQYLTAGVRP